MTVKELIKELKKMDQNLPVCVVTHGAFVGTRVNKIISIVKGNSIDWENRAWTFVDGEFIRIKF